MVRKRIDPLRTGLVGVVAALLAASHAHAAAVGYRRVVEFMDPVTGNTVLASAIGIGDYTPPVHTVPGGILTGNYSAPPSTTPTSGLMQKQTVQIMSSESYTTPPTSTTATTPVAFPIKLGKLVFLRYSAKDMMTPMGATSMIRLCTFLKIEDAEADIPIPMVNGPGGLPSAVGVYTRTVTTLSGAVSTSFGLVGLAPNGPGSSYILPYELPATATTDTRTVSGLGEKSGVIPVQLALANGMTLSFDLTHSVTGLPEPSAAMAFWTGTLALAGLATRRR